MYGMGLKERESRLLLKLALIAHGLDSFYSLAALSISPSPGCCHCSGPPPHLIRWSTEQGMLLSEPSTVYGGVMGIYRRSKESETSVPKEFVTRCNSSPLKRRFSLFAAGRRRISIIIWFSLFGVGDETYQRSGGRSRALRRMVNLLWLDSSQLIIPANDNQEELNCYKWPSFILLNVFNIMTNASTGRRRRYHVSYHIHITSPELVAQYQKATNFPKRHDTVN